jgi:MinD-like ATPase involved in chromosome partitioning or flagellar assembly
MISDIGTLLDARREFVDLADQLLIVTTTSAEHRWSAHTVLDRLAQGGHTELVRHAITVINRSSETESAPDDDLAEGYRARCRGVVVVPYDDHLASPGEIDLEQLAPKTLDAYIDLAALVAEGFPGAGP